VTLRTSLLPALAACLAAAACTAGEPGQGLAYVSNQKGHISVIDLATLKTVSTIDPGAPEPRGIGISADGRLLVTANREAGNISVIERQTGKLLRQIAIGENPEFVRVRGNQAFVTFEPESEGGPPPKPGSEEERKLDRKSVV
jgi:DNA-binding beta-propeller fold protein YncE